jgi:hypothetical protein
MSAPVRRSVASLDDAALLQIAQLHCAWRLTRGAAHTLNNALTAVTGLVGMPGEEGELETELSRCTRVARTLTSHPPTQFGRIDETELGAMIRGVGPLLDDTLSRRIRVERSAPTDLLYLEADPARVELLSLLLAYRLTDACDGDGILRVSADHGEKPESACLTFDLLSERLPGDLADRILDPASTANVPEALAMEASLAVASGCGGNVACSRLPGGVRLRATFPAIAL